MATLPINSSPASAYTIENAKVKTFSDFLDSFSKNPQTGYLGMVQNEDAVKQSVRNLVLTERTERPYQPWIGSKINSLLFDPLDQLTSDALKVAIEDTIRNNEPRAQLLEVDVIANEDLDAYLINVIFSILNIPGQNFDLNLILRRAR